MKSPDALRTIGEVSKMFDVPVYVLRFWEKKINLISPKKKKMEQDIMINLKSN